MLIVETGPVAERGRVREIDDEGRRMVRIVRRGSGSVVCPPASWDQVEGFTALRCSALDGTGHATGQERASMIGRSIIWRSNHACDQLLRRIVARASVA